VVAAARVQAATAARKMSRWRGCSGGGHEEQGRRSAWCLTRKHRSSVEKGQRAE
jgi:hypothetical protein